MERLELNSYQEEALKNKVYGYGDKITYPALGLANETGEVLGKIKKILRDNDGIFTDKNLYEVAKELGDVLWYVAALADDIGYSLEDIAKLNITKLTDRRSRGVIQGDGDNR